VQRIKSTGVLLPPYSPDLNPDLNPIEEAFSTVFILITAPKENNSNSRMVSPLERKKYF
jgi:hypothetical protein